MATTAQTALHWSEQGYVPDKVIRYGIKRLLAGRALRKNIQRLVTEF